MADSAECPAIGLPTGVSVQVEPDLGTATSAEVTVCEGQRCTTRRVELAPATAPAATSCAGDNCGARLEPTGGKTGFATVDLPAGPIEVTVKLFDAANTFMTEGTVATTARTEPTCPSGRQVALKVTRSGVSVSS